LSEHIDPEQRRARLAERHRLLPRTRTDDLPQIAAPIAVFIFKQFFDGALRRLLKWLNRRSQRPRYNWQGFTAILEHFKVERPRIVGHPKTRKATAMA